MLFSFEIYLYGAVDRLPERTASASGLRARIGAANSIRATLYSLGACGAIGKIDRLLEATLPAGSGVLVARLDDRQMRRWRPARGPS
jgi:hypothetical protein